MVPIVNFVKLHEMGMYEMQLSRTLFRTYVIHGEKYQKYKNIGINN